MNLMPNELVAKLADDQWGMDLGPLGVLSDFEPDYGETQAVCHARLEVALWLRDIADLHGKMLPEMFGLGPVLEPRLIELRKVTAATQFQLNRVADELVKAAQEDIHGRKL